MPNFREHQQIAFCTNLIAHAVREKQRENFPYEQPTAELPPLGRLFVSVLGSQLGGALPDILEPADSPNHRGSLHSVGVGVLLLAAVNSDRSGNVDPTLRLFLESLSVGYLSHLAADALTPKSIPVLG